MEDGCWLRGLHDGAADAGWLACGREAVPQWLPGFTAGTGGARIDIELLEIEDGDLLRLAVFGQDEVALLQIFDDLARFILDADVDDDQGGVGRECHRRLLRRKSSERQEK